MRYPEGRPRHPTSQSSRHTTRQDEGSVAGSWRKATALDRAIENGRVGLGQQREGWLIPWPWCDAKRVIPALAKPLPYIVVGMTLVHECPSLGRRETKPNGPYQRELSKSDSGEMEGMGSQAHVNDSLRSRGRAWNKTSTPDLCPIERHFAAKS